MLPPRVAHRVLLPSFFHLGAEFIILVEPVFSLLSSELISCRPQRVSIEPEISRVL